MAKIKSKFLFIAIILLTSCATSQYVAPTEIQSFFSFCYDTSLRQHNTKISYNGYYSFDNPNDNWFTPQDYVIFYPNGSYSSQFLGYKMIDIGVSSNLYYDSVFNYIAKGNDSIIKDYFLWSYFNKGEWGQYRISNDTILVQSVFRPDPGLSMGVGWSIFEKAFKIIDKNTIELLNPKNHEKNVIGKFVSNDNIPSSSHWLIKERWYWCDKQKFDSLINAPSKKEIRKEKRYYNRLYRKLK